MSTYVLYCRVSTAKQGISGLGLEAQQEAARRFVGESAAIVSAYVEIESGRNCARPQLAAALRDCRRRKATLLIARLDRLSRNVRFIAELLESDVPIVAADMPSADRFTLHIMRAVAEQETRAVSSRTKAALAAARARGVKLGGNYSFSCQDRARGSQLGNATRSTSARERSLGLMPIITELREAGSVTLAAIAAGLNARCLPAARGGRWTPTGVARALAAAE